MTPFSLAYALSARRFPIGFLGVWAGIFWLWQAVNGRFFLADSYEYLSVAHNLASAGMVYTGDLSDGLVTENLTKRPPLYPLFLILTGAASGWYLLTTAVQSLLALFNLWLASDLVKMWKGQQAPAWVWVLLAAMYPAQWIYANLLMAEILFQSCLIFWVWAVTHAILRRKVRFWAAAAIVLGASVLVKPVVYLAFLPAAAWGLWLAYRQKSFAWAVWSGTPLLILLAFMSWNHARTGYFHVSSIQSRSLLLYTARFLLIKETGEAAADARIDLIWEQAQQTAHFAQGQRLIQDSVRVILREHQIAYTRFHVQGMAHFFLDPGRFDLYAFFGLASPEGGLLDRFSARGYAGISSYFQSQPLWIWVLLGWVFLGNALRLTALGFWAWLYPRTAVWAAALAPVFYLAAVTGINGASRFAVPVFPIAAALLASLPYERLVSRRQ